MRYLMWSFPKTSASKCPKGHKLLTQSTMVSRQTYYHLMDHPENQGMESMGTWPLLDESLDTRVRMWPWKLRFVVVFYQTFKYSKNVQKIGSCITSDSD